MLLKKIADSILEESRCEQPKGKMLKTRILWEEFNEIDRNANKSEMLRQLADRLTQSANARVY
ncbi:MAG: hypothetical protein ACI8YP_002716 [Algoriphagus sp.]|jgi:hypothetical protein